MTIWAVRLDSPPLPRPPLPPPKLLFLSPRRAGLSGCHLLTPTWKGVESGGPASLGTRREGDRRGLPSLISVCEVLEPAPESPHTVSFIFKTSPPGRMKEPSRGQALIIIISSLIKRRSGIITKLSASCLCLFSPSCCPSPPPPSSCFPQPFTLFCFCFKAWGSGSWSHQCRGVLGPMESITMPLSLAGGDDTEAEGAVEREGACF